MCIEYDIVGQLIMPVPALTTMVATTTTIDRSM